MSFIYHLGKTNVVVDTLNWLSMCSISHINDDKRSLFIFYVQRIARFVFILTNFEYSSFIVQNGLELSLVYNV